MFCGKCGAQNPDGAAFCKECGEKLEAVGVDTGVDTAPVVSAKAADSSKRNKIIGIAAVAILAVVILVAALMMFGKKGYKAIVKQYMEAVLDLDVDKMLDLLPDEVVNELLDEEGVEDIAELLSDSDFTESLDLAKSMLDSVDLSYEIVDISDMSAKDIEELQDDFDDEDIDLEISDGKQVTVDILLKRDEFETTKTLELQVIKVNGSWRVSGLDNIKDLF